MNALPLAAALAFGCTKTETQEQIIHTYDAYDGGPVFPDLRPKFTLPNHDVGLVTNNGSDTLSVLDLGGAKVLGDAPVGRNPVDIDGPHHVAADRAKGFAYVALSYPAPASVPGPHAAHGSSTRDGFVQKLALDDLRPVGEVRVQPNPGDIVLGPDRATLYVTHFDLAKALDPTTTLQQKRATLAIIDTTKILASSSPDPLFITVCVAPHGVAVVGRSALLACYGEDAIGIVNLDAPSAAPVLVPVGPGPGQPGSPVYGPYADVASPDGTVLAVSDTESKDVRFFDVATKAMRTTLVKTFGAPYFAAWSSDGSKLYVPTQAPAAIVVADAATGQTLTTQALTGCTAPHEATFSTDQSTLYVVCEGDHMTPSVVLALDPATLATKATFDVGVYPDRVFVMGAP